MLDITSYLSTTWLLTLAVAGLTILWLWSVTKRSYPLHGIPPFPVPPSPLVGHTFQVGGNLRDRMKELRAKKGDFFSLDFFGHLSIVVNGYENIKEILVKHHDGVPDRREELEKLLGQENKGVLAGHGANWKEQRTISISILRSFGMGKNILAEKIQEEINVYLKELSDWQGEPKDPRVLTNVSVSNVICSLVVGKRFEHRNPAFVNLINHISTALKAAGKLLPVMQFPILAYLPGDLFHFKQLKEGFEVIDRDFSRAQLREIKKTFNEDEEPSNFITAYLQEMVKNEKNGKQSFLNEENLTSNIRGMFIAGTETTSTTILWCLLHMLHHPDVQEKVYREIEDKVGLERLPNMADKTKLNYLNAVILETQRASNLVPIIGRAIKNTFEYKGYTFPAGSSVMFVLDSVQLDKTTWGDPDIFRPERFLDKAGNLVKPDELISFGLGRRVCMGEALAKMELFLFLSALFQRFRFEPEDKSAPLPPLKEVFGGTCSPQPFKIRFIHRNT